MEKKKTCHLSENIYLIGFMGCGKSTIAGYLREQYGMQVLEMDEQIEKEEQMTISEIFRKKGEEYFRQAETLLLQRMADQTNTVISCGGGTAMRQCNVDEMKKNGKIVLLQASPETVYERVKNSHTRPLLENRMNTEAIRELMEARREKYEAAADIFIRTDGKCAAEICCEIMEQLKKI